VDYVAHTDDPRPGANVDFLLSTARPKNTTATFTRELCDMVRMSIFAARNEAGDLLWYTWCPGKQRKSVPDHGLMCVGLSVFGARVLHADMTSWTPRHFDLALVDWLRNKENEKEGLEAGFVSKSVGHFATHVSGCEPGLGVRDAEWDKPYIQEGTRGGPRYICRFNKKGEGLQYLADGKAIPFDDPHLVWKTERPPDDVDLRAYYRSLLPPNASTRVQREVRSCLHSFKYRHLVEDEEEVLPEPLRDPLHKSKRPASKPCAVIIPAAS
jgi:hypothetical protein